MENSSAKLDEDKRLGRLDELMAGVKQGSRSAFQSLFEATSAKVYGILMRILRNRSEADEVHQEVYLRLWTKSFLYDPTRAHAECWIAHMARHAAIDRLRAMGRRPGGEAFLDTVESDAPGPEQVAIQHSDIRLLTLCLDRLEPSHQRCVRLAYLDGASYEELVSQFQVPMNTMKSWLRRSLRRLRVCLESGGQTDEIS